VKLHDWAIIALFVIVSAAIVFAVQ